MTQPNDYQLLTQDERDDMHAQTLLAQETDLFMHRINRERYDAILAGPLPPGPFRSRVEKLRGETIERTAEVEAVIEALKPQLPPKARLDASAARLRARAQKVV